MIAAGAIDLGGTKIEARLFADDLSTVETRRVPTPVAAFEPFLDALCGQIAWLQARSGRADLPIGVGLPGTADPQTGIAFASNVPITGRNVGAELRGRLGRSFVLANDCMAFAVSEAHGGAGAGARNVVGLILGTGLAAGQCIDAQVPPRFNAMALELGHVGMAQRALEPHGLPLWSCGCGKRGCIESYVSGSGLTALARHVLGEALAPAELAARAETGDAGAEAVLRIWASLAAECLLTVQLIGDPDCIVLGGGLSKMPGVIDRLGAAFEAVRLGSTRCPPLRLAQHGDSSGARGMALLALRSERDGTGEWA